MITSDWVRMMARYAAWQNGQQMAVAEALGEDARRLDRGAFFGSIHATLNHLVWADRIWSSRLMGAEPPRAGSIAMSVEETEDWAELSAARATLDAATLRWAAGLNDADLRGDLVWYSGAAGREVAKPLAVVITHVFNHQTHHRGQVNAMITAAGGVPGDTDLFLMPGEAAS